ncbi:MAG TPA: TlyA family RNA methyltransferase [Burkholderiaceae bacterium]|nr:TlyA family RNA methyltransferase [Burkholderiaceae bacterium]
MRADQLLVHRGLASTRAQAQRLISSGVRWLTQTTDEAKWKKVVKNGDIIPDDAKVELLNDAEARYVSRGGLKLEGALQQLGLSVQGATCLDVGQSTGGFTDCLLQHDAAYVVGVDVGFGQLHDKIRTDPRVLCVEHTNAREVGLIATNIIALQAINTPSEGQFSTENQVEFDLIVGDLSFISQTLVLPAIAPLLKPLGQMVMLVKPQFELNFGQVGKGGIVKDETLYAQVEKRVRDAYQAQGLSVQAWLKSPIDGGDGNREFFIHATKK